MPTALLSVYDKGGICEFADKLYKWGWSLLASGGTAQVIRDAGIPVRDVAEIVGGGAILGHRVVTLSREIHAGLLAKRTIEDMSELDRLGIPFIDLVYVTLYPLTVELGKPQATLESIAEKTDIGGPTLLRSAAKGRRFIVTSAESALRVLQYMDSMHGMPRESDPILRQCAFEAERLVASYVLASAAALSPSKESRMILESAYEILTCKELEIRANV